MHRLSLVDIEGIYDHSHIDVQYKEDVRLAPELSASVCFIFILASSSEKYLFEWSIRKGNIVPHIGY
jgi:hypothetical protein